MYEEKIYIDTISGDLSYSINVRLIKFIRHPVSYLNLVLKRKGENEFQLFSHLDINWLVHSKIPRDRPVTLEMLTSFFGPHHRDILRTFVRESLTSETAASFIHFLDKEFDILRSSKSKTSKSQFKKAMKNIGQTQMKEDSEQSTERYKPFFTQPKNRIQTFTIGGKTTSLMEVALTNGLSNYLIPLMLKYDNDADYVKGRGWQNFVEYLKQIKKYYENNSGRRGLTFTEILQSEFNNPLLNDKWKKMRAVDKGKMMNFVKYLDENPQALRPKKESPYSPKVEKPQVKQEPVKEKPKAKKTVDIPKRKSTVNKYRK